MAAKPPSGAALQLFAPRRVAPTRRNRHAGLDDGRGKSPLLVRALLAEALTYSRKNRP